MLEITCFPSPSMFKNGNTFSFLMKFSADSKERCPSSQKPRNTTKSHHTTNLTLEIQLERQERVVVSAQERTIRKLSRRQALCRISWRTEYSRVNQDGWNFVAQSCIIFFSIGRSQVTLLPPWSGNLPLHMLEKSEAMVYLLSTLMASYPLG